MQQFLALKMIELFSENSEEEENKEQEKLELNICKETVAKTIFKNFDKCLIDYETFQKQLIDSGKIDNLNKYKYSIEANAQIIVYQKLISDLGIWEDITKLFLQNPTESKV